mmetsp:Transcript_11225/g.35590  ORF Transcript_11225/g.35590 Transcript_11225/m.35590 type:complete len:205 (-) Transcript_11225:916-1530(-)
MSRCAGRLLGRGAWGEGWEHHPPLPFKAGARRPPPPPRALAPRRLRLLVGSLRPPHVRQRRGRPPQPRVPVRPPRPPRAHVFRGHSPRPPRAHIFRGAGGAGPRMRRPPGGRHASLRPEAALHPQRGTDALLPRDPGVLEALPRLLRQQGRDPRVVEDLFDREAVVRDRLQQLPDEVARLLREPPPCREAESPPPDLRERLLVV